MLCSISCEAWARFLILLVYFLFDIKKVTCVLIVQNTLGNKKQIRVEIFFISIVTLVHITSIIFGYFGSVCIITPTFSHDARL